MVSREKGWAAAFRASPGTLAAPFTGVLAWWGLAGLCPFNHIWKLRKLGVFPDALSFSFAAAPWLLGADGHPSPTAVRVAHSEAECAGVGGQALQFSTQRQPPQFCELRRSSPDNSQCTPHSVGDRQVLPAPIRKTPALPPTGPQGRLRGKKRFSLPPGATHSLFQESGVPRRNPAKRLRWGRGKRRSAASGGKSEPVSRKRRDWRTRRGRESQCRDGVQGGNGAE